MKIEKIKTPAYVCELPKLINNLEILNKIGQKSGAKILCALKGFAFSPAMSYIKKYLNGVCASGLYEAKYAKEFKIDEIHTYSPAFKDEEFDEILEISSHIVFNSINQLKKYRKKLNLNRSFGLRINPLISFSVCENYNPCSKISRFGVKLYELKEALKSDPNLLDGIEGFHIHALCEQNSTELKKVIEKFEQDFKEFFPNLKWINFGGGHHITKKGYDQELLIEILKEFKDRYNLEIFIEPGEAVGWECGYLVSEILDILDQGDAKLAIIDSSAEAHMPDTILMPYRPAIEGEDKNAKFAYRFGANTCLSGDVVGLESGDEIYKFNKELKVGDRIKFCDQIHYTIVKNTTFNGIKLPSLVLVDENDEILELKEFGFSEYKNRN